MNHVIDWRKNTFWIGLLFGVLIILQHKLLIDSLEGSIAGIIIAWALMMWGARPSKISPSAPLLSGILLFSIISCRIEAKSIYALGILFFGAYTFFLMTNRFHWIAFLCLVFYTPAFDKIVNIFEVEIKHILCYLSYFTLKDILHISHIEGIHLFIGTKKISIDTACMGLSLFKTGILFTTAIVVIKENISHKRYKATSLILLYLISVGLSLVSNYFRIISLILFDNTSENLMHYAIGLISFAIYHLMPLIFISRYILPTQEFSPSNTNIHLSPYRQLGIYLLFFSMLVYVGTFMQKNHFYSPNIIKVIEGRYPLSKGKWANKDVYKILEPRRLTYIKSKGHLPLICWTGNGYTIIRTSQTFMKVNHRNTTVNLTILEKNGQRIYAYWWYEIDQTVFTSFWKMSLHQLLFGGKSILINENWEKPIL